MATITSTSTSAVDVSAAAATFGTWFLGPVNAAPVALPIHGKPQATRRIHGGSLRVLGRAADVVVTDAVSGLGFDLTLLCTGLAQWQSLDAGLQSQERLYLRSVQFGVVPVRVVDATALEVEALGSDRALYSVQTQLTQVDDA